MKKLVSIFLDDVRKPTDCTQYMSQRIGMAAGYYEKPMWVIVRDYQEFVAAVNVYYKDLFAVSFDHDLSDEHYQDLFSDENWYRKEEIKLDYENYKEKTGLDCAKYLTQFYKENNLSLPHLFVHSMNPVGTQNIINHFKNIQN